MALPRFKTSLKAESTNCASAACTNCAGEEVE